jgi:hypothetical protein
MTCFIITGLKSSKASSHSHSVEPIQVLLTVLNEVRYGGHSLPKEPWTDIVSDLKTY